MPSKEIGDVIAVLIGFVCLVGGSLSALLSVYAWFGPGERRERLRDSFTFWGFLGYGLAVEVTVALCGALLLDRVNP